jgi:hypothetical protein
LSDAFVQRPGLGPTTLPDVTFPVGDVDPPARVCLAAQVERAAAEPGRRIGGS